jgi:hypothetical protein
MAFSPIAAATNQPAAQQVLQPSGHHKHRGQSTASISDVDVQSSSVSPAGSAHVKPGSILNITA